VDWVSQDFRYCEHRNNPAFCVSNFDARFAQSGAAIHKLPHNVTRTVLGFGEGILKGRKIGPFLVTAHSLLITKIDEVMWHPHTA
jgi:hypothetical protein